MIEAWLCSVDYVRKYYPRLHSFHATRNPQAEVLWTKMHRPQGRWQCCVSPRLVERCLDQPPPSSRSHRICLSAVAATNHRGDGVGCITFGMQAAIEHLEVASQAADLRVVLVGRIKLHTAPTEGAKSIPVVPQSHRTSYKGYGEHALVATRHRSASLFQNTL